MTLTPSGKHSQRKASNQNSSLSSSKSVGVCSSWITIIVLVIIFFLTGVYVGSLFVVESLPSDSNSIGIPGTKNIITKLNQEAHDSLRREEKFIEDSLKKVPTTRQDQSQPQQQPSNQHSPLRSESIYKPPPPPAKIIQPGQVKPQKSIPQESFVMPSTDHTTSSVEVHDDCYVSAPSSIDDKVLLISGWVYLDSTSIHDRDMRTIYSNKYTGCEAASNQNGISLYVNGWQTHDHKLYFEYGGSGSGCSKVVSDDSASINLGEWFHVASFISDERIILFVNGKVVVSQEVTDSHIPQSSHPLLFGQYAPDAPYSLYGKLSDFIILRSLQDHSVEGVSSIVSSIYVSGYSSVSKSPYIFAYYPFDYKKGTEIAREVNQQLNANYVCQYDGNVHGVRIRLVDGVNGRPVTEEMKKESDRQGQIRKQKIKEGMKHVWSGYKSFAWGRDELKPISNHGQDNWGGIGMTILDSLDTLYLMGMKDEFNEAVQWVKNSLHFNHAGTVSVFEITIRALGGLLAAYDLSKEKILLDKAKEFGEKLIRSFQTRSGIPTAMIDLGSGSPSGGWAGNNAILSELGTLQVEFRYLAQETKQSYFEDVSMKPVKLMASKNPNHGLYPIKVRIDDGGFADSMITFGALGDSFYEYLLKLWIQGGKKETWLRDLYDRSMDGAINKLLMASSPSGLAFFSDWNGHSNFRKMDHLVCFVPGLLALGAYTDPTGIDSPRAKRDLRVAKALMYTCREMYHRTSTGIAPEYVEFPEGRDMVPAGSAPFYILRPETAESLFILNQLTGDPIYRDWAWEIWEAIDKECRTGSGYGSLRNVNNRNAGIDDRMESFFLAETIKYLYLAQDPDKPVDLMEKVFNTEAHPLTILEDSHKPTTL